MKDFIYIRFFRLAQDEIPADSAAVCRADSNLLTAELRDRADLISDWMVRHPDGKVDVRIL